MLDDRGAFTLVTTAPARSLRVVTRWAVYRRSDSVNGIVIAGLHGNQMPAALALVLGTDDRPTGGVYARHADFSVEAPTFVDEFQKDMREADAGEGTAPSIAPQSTHPLDSV